jgi:hypothetical protein
MTALMTRSRPRQREYALHCAVAAMLERVLPLDAWYTSVGHGRRGPKTGAQLRAMGVRAGVPDILIVWRGRAYWIELKAGHGRTQPAQELCHALLAAAGCPPPKVARSPAGVTAALIEWGLPLRGRIAASDEPAYWRKAAGGKRCP